MVFSGTSPVTLRQFSLSIYLSLSLDLTKLSNAAVATIHAVMPFSSGVENANQQTRRLRRINRATILVIRLGLDTTDINIVVL